MHLWDLNIFFFPAIQNIVALASAKLFYSIFHWEQTSLF